ncbi:Uncharacterised protein [Halioglobus japonicus]|nr:Uncharacterised protein [Halioglobus japonicus]
MDSPLLTIAPFIFFAFVMFLEYRNPLWKQFIKSGALRKAETEGARETQMVFFWKSAETYHKSQEFDYWNAMELEATNEGLSVNRPLFLFGRRSAFFPWAALSPGSTFYAWLTKRRTLRLAGTELQFSVTERFYKKHVQHYLESA